MPCKKILCFKCGKLKESYLTMNPKGICFKVTPDGEIIAEEKNFCEECSRVII
jgi:hypothetical protein